MTSLTMNGHVDGDFALPDGVVRVTVSTELNPDTGITTETETGRYAVAACVQPLSPKELQTLTIGNERYADYKKIYINSGDFSIYDLRGYFEFLGGKWKPINLDRRDSRKYCRYVVARIDA